MLRREAVISGSTTDLHTTITVDELMDTLLGKLKDQEGTGAGEPTSLRLHPEVLAQSRLLAWHAGDRVLDLGSGLVAAKGGNAGGNSNAGGNGIEPPALHLPTRNQLACESAQLETRTTANGTSAASG